MISTKRRRYLIKRAFQLKYTAIILFVVLLTTLISCIAIYFATFPYLSEQLANVYPQGRLMGLLKNAHFNLLLSVVLLLPLAAWFSIILSNRIAGPWYRLENMLKDIAEGKIVSEVKLRKGDELQSLAHAINAITRNLNSISQWNRSHLQTLEETIRDLEQELNREPIDIMKTKLLLSKLQENSADLKTSPTT